MLGSRLLLALIASSGNSGVITQTLSQSIQTRFVEGGEHAVMGTAGEALGRGGARCKARQRALAKFAGCVVTQIALLIA